VSVDFYLVSAARRAHRLRPGRGYTFGREEGVDILLQDTLVSRRHAEMRWTDEDQWLVADLGSRNGVMVNGKRVEQPTKVGDGDQIQVGGQVFRLYLLPPGAEPSSLVSQAPQISNLETMGPGFNLQELTTQNATFTGVVTGGVMELMQFFQVTAKSGRLDLSEGASTASVWLVKGAPTHAVYGPAKGIDALLALAHNSPPRFSFHADAPPATERTIQGSAQGVLMEVARLMDETHK
jgi:hypothetical protein